MDMIVERGIYSDLDEIEELYDELNDSLDRGINYPGWKKGVYPTRADACSGIESNTLFVIRKESKIVGSIILNNNPESAYEGAAWEYKGDYSSVLVVHTLVVHPEYSKMGIGPKLMEFAETYGKENNIGAIRLDVYEKNLPAIALYRRCNYKYIGRVDLGLREYGLDWFELYEKILENEE